MFKMDEVPSIMLDDERVLVMRRDAGLGRDTVVVDGIRVHRGFAAEFALNCNIQPVSGEERIDAGEGQRFVEEYWCYIADSEEPTQVDDLIFRPEDGCWYIVVDSESWGSYSKLRIGLQDVGPSPYAGKDPMAEYERQLLVSDIKKR